MSRLPVPGADRPGPADRRSGPPGGPRPRLSTLGRGLGLAVVIACLATLVVTGRERAEIAAVRERAEAAVSRASIDEAEAGARLERLERAVAEARAHERRDREAAAWIRSSADELDLLAVLVAGAEADLADLTDLSDVQVAQIRVLRGCVATLDSVRAALGRDDAAAAAVHLEAGRRGCQDAEVLADGASHSRHPFDFPDPNVLWVGGAYLAFGTNGPAGTVQLLESSDLDEWAVRGPALDGVPGWAEPGYTWAPAVLRLGSGYALYYTVRHRDSGRQCISVATASHPAGPYHDRSSGPLVCQLDEGGSIDPNPYRDEEGRPHLAWKSEGETVGGTSAIWTRRLTEDGTALTWFPSLLVVADRSWEAGVVEAPSMVRTSEGWILLYSGNDWRTEGYAIGYARCAGPVGPCLKPPDNIALSSTSEVRGPGGAEAFRAVDGRVMVAYAGWDPGSVGPPNPRRLHVAPVRLTPDAVHVG